MSWRRQDLEKSAALRARARRLYLRASDYGLRGLDVRHRGFSQAPPARFEARPCWRPRPPTCRSCIGPRPPGDSAISLSKDNPDLIADQPIVEALIDRASALDPDFDSGAIHGFLISYELARQGAGGDPVARATQHFDREVALTKGQLASPFVSFAEAVSVPNQDRAGFESLIQRALAVDADARPEWRLQNLVMQRRARWLLSREDRSLHQVTRSSSHESTLFRRHCPPGSRSDSVGAHRAAAERRGTAESGSSSRHSRRRIPRITARCSRWARSGARSATARSSSSSIPGGTQGSEADIVKRMSVGELQAANAFGGRPDRN